MKKKKQRKVVASSKKIEEMNPKIFYKALLSPISGDKRKITYELLKTNMLDDAEPPTKNDIKQSVLDILTYAPIIETLLEEKKITLTQKEMENILRFLNSNIYMYYRYLESKNFKRGYNFDIDYLHKENEYEKNEE